MEESCRRVKPSLPREGASRGAWGPASHADRRTPGGRGSPRHILKGEAPSRLPAWTCRVSRAQCQWDALRLPPVSVRGAVPGDSPGTKCSWHVALQ